MNISASGKMCDLISQNYQTLQVLGRFGLPLGVGDKTIEEVCREAGVHTQTFLAVVNFKIGEPMQVPLEQLSVQTLLAYLRNAHSYFFDFALPNLRKKFIEAINYSSPDSKIPILIIRFFDEYVSEIAHHMQHEDEQVFPYAEALLRNEKPNLPLKSSENQKPLETLDSFSRQHHVIDDQHIADKLNELKNLIIKYYPDTQPNNMLAAALHEVFELEQDLATHCAIEDNILIPAIRHLEKHASRTNTHPASAKKPEEMLSEREKEVLAEVVKGLSNKEIADELCISVHTVITHRKNISRKLNIHSPAGLTIYAIVNNLVDISTLT